MAVSDLFKVSAPPSYTNISTSRSDMPEWWDTAAQNAISKATAIANTPFMPYRGPRVASFTPDQQQAFSGVRNMAGTVDPFVTQAGSYINRSGELFNQEDFNKFMSPYQSGVLDVLAKQGARNLSENLLPQINDSFIKAGQFGSRGNFDLTGRALRDTQESILDKQAQLLDTGFQNAMNQYQGALGRMGNVGAALGNLGQVSRGQQEGSLANLLGIGDLQQKQAQKNLDVGYQDYLQQRDKPMNDLALQIGVLSNFRPNAVTTNATTSPIDYTVLPSAAQNAVGTLGQLLGRL